MELFFFFSLLKTSNVFVLLLLPPSFFSYTGLLSPRCQVAYHILAYSFSYNRIFFVHIFFSGVGTIFSTNRTLFADSRSGSFVR